MNERNKGKKYVYKEIAPAAAIKDTIEKIWIFDTASDPVDNKQFNLLADYTSSLIINQQPRSKNPSILVSGPNLMNVPIANIPGSKIIAFRFIPLKMNAAFGIVPGDIKNKAVDLNRLIEPELFEKLYGLAADNDDLEQLINSVSAFLSERDFPGKYRSDKIIEEFIVRIIKSRGMLKLEQEYAKLTLGRRQFQRNFAVLTGITPKEFCRIARFHTVTRNLVKNDFRHFDVMFDAGYYDQSHYFREFRKFIGMLPSGFESRQKNIAHEDLIE